MYIHFYFLLHRNVAIQYFLFYHWLNSNRQKEEKKKQPTDREHCTHFLSTIYSTAYRSNVLFLLHKLQLFIHFDCMCVFHSVSSIACCESEIRNLVCIRFATYVSAFWQGDMTDNTVCVFLVQQTIWKAIKCTSIAVRHTTAMYRYIQLGIVENLSINFHYIDGVYWQLPPLPSPVISNIVKRMLWATR